MKKNEIMDTSPSNIHNGQTYETILKLRPRDKSKELNQDMRFTAKNYAEKLNDKITRRNPSYSYKNCDMFHQTLVGSNGNLKPYLEKGEQKDVKNLLNRLGFHHRSQN
jgi:hypothetical protein